jgi:hypothetical protein
MITDKHKRFIAMTAGAALALLAGAAGAAGAAEQPHFPSPEAAVQALTEAADNEAPDAVMALFGPQGAALRSGDSVADALERKGFAAAAKEATRIDLDGDDYAILSVGSNAWPFAVPLIKEADGWRFDTEAGVDTLLDRRIGRNELHTIAVAREFVDAQHEYAAQDLNGDGLKDYAQKLMSADGERNGLYWPVSSDEPESPMGRLVAEAVAAGYQPGQGGKPVPYHGYYYRPLTSQGGNAPGGAKSYIEDGHMTRGFALLAYPAEYGNSGIMTFLINQSGILFQTDLGEDTAALAAAITEYDPDRSWEPVTD